MAFATHLRLYEQSSAGWAPQKRTPLPPPQASALTLYFCFFQRRPITRPDVAVAGQPAKDEQKKIKIITRQGRKVSRCAKRLNLMPIHDSQTYASEQQRRNSKAKQHPHAQQRGNPKGVMYPVHTRLSVLPLWAPLTSFPSLRSRVGEIYPHTLLGPSGNLVCAGGRWDDQQQVSQPPPPPAPPPSSTPFRRVNPKYLSASHTALLLVSPTFPSKNIARASHSYTPKHHER